MKIYRKKIEIKSSSQIEFVDITGKVNEVISDSGIREGEAAIFAMGMHTSDGLWLISWGKMAL